MTRATTEGDSSLPQNDTEGHLFDNWIDPLEAVIRGRIRGFIEDLFTRNSMPLWLARVMGDMRRTARSPPILPQLQALRVTGMEAVRAR